jgi:hypothetical protein
MSLPPEKQDIKRLIALLGKMELVEYAIECAISGDIGPFHASGNSKRTFALHLREVACEFQAMAEEIDPLADDSGAEQLLKPGTADLLRLAQTALQERITRADVMSKDLSAAARAQLARETVRDREAVHRLKAILASVAEGKPTATREDVPAPMIRPC